MKVLINHKTRRSVLCGAFLIMAVITAAQSPQLTTGVDRQDIIIGEPLRYRVQASFPANAYTIKWLNIPDSVAHFEVIERQKADSAESNGILKVQQVITLTSFDSGRQTIPSFPVNFEPLAGGDAITVLTDSVRVNVSFSPMDSVKTFHDIKTIIGVKESRSLWLWVAAGASFLLMIFLLYYVLRKRRKKPAQLYASKLSPLEEAMQSLQELQKQQLLDKQEVKQFHSTLTEIFKRYISRKTGSEFYSLTSEEVLLKLNELSISRENISITANTLRMADAVKFARYLPGHSQSEEAFSNHKLVIRELERLITKS